MADIQYKKGELLFNQTITPSLMNGVYIGAGGLPYMLPPEVLIIEFNEVEYVVKLINMEWGSLYGDFDQDSPIFSRYPFCCSFVPSQEDHIDLGFFTEGPDSYTVKIYTAIPDSDSSSEPITIRSYIDKNLTNLNWNILPQIFESEGVELTEEIERYLRETPKNTNWNIMQTIISSSEDGMEIWFSSDTYVDNDMGRIFTFLNPDNTEHITELLTNAENYRIYLNNEELLTFRRVTETHVVWNDGDSFENTTKAFMAMIDSEENIGVSTMFVDSSTAPTSIEIAVKQK